MKTINVAITGAAGQIGYALLFRVASGQMFGSDVLINLRLIDLEDNLPKLVGVQMELDDCAFPLLKNVVCTADLSVGFKEVNWAILVGATPRKAGMERSELLSINGKIFKTQGKALNDYAAKDIRTLVVGNPCNTNAMIAMNSAKDIPNDQFYAMTMLDQNRAKIQLAKKEGASVLDVKKMVVWGNHSSALYPDFYHAMIGAKPVTEIIDEAWLKNDFIGIVQQRGAEVIKARGASSAASAANAIIDTVYHLTHDTKEDDWFSIAKCSTGEYGVDEGLMFSFPCQVKQGKLEVVKNIQHNDFATKKINASLQELREEKKAVSELLC
jgi:malate dehydrogenase